MTPEKLLQFWFAPHPPQEGSTEEIYTYRPQWFVKSAHFDQEVKENFLQVWEVGRQGKLRAWEETPEGVLALVLLFDQMPRNMFRDQAASFETDPQALQLSKQAILNEFDLDLHPVQRWFLYMPFEHSENLRDQDISIELFAELQTQLPDSQVLEYAERHRRIIARFGRFPHRNKILQRKSTPEELEFLKTPGSGF
jgi:uncharacterized protein (DUF924 family)